MPKSVSMPLQTSRNPLVLGPRPVKTVEDRWKPLSCRSSSPIKKIRVGSRSMGILMLKKMRSCKNFGGPVKLGFFMWLPVLWSCKGPKVFPMSALTEFRLHYIRVSDPRSSEAMAILVACSSDNVNRRLWTCTLHNLGRPHPRKSLHVGSSSDSHIQDKNFGHGLGSV